MESQNYDASVLDAQALIDRAFSYKEKILNNIYGYACTKKIPRCLIAEGAGINTTKLNRLVEKIMTRKIPDTFKDTAPRITMSDFTNICLSCGFSPEQWLNGCLDEKWDIPSGRHVDDVEVALYYKDVMKGKIEIAGMPLNAMAALNRLLFMDSDRYFHKRFLYASYNQCPEKVRRMSRLYLLDVLLLKAAFNISLDEFAEKLIQYS